MDAGGGVVGSLGGIGSESHRRKAMAGVMGLRSYGSRGVWPFAIHENENENEKTCSMLHRMGIIMKFCMNLHVVCGKVFCSLVCI